MARDTQSIIHFVKREDPSCAFPRAHRPHPPQPQLPGGRGLISEGVPWGEQGRGPRGWGDTECEGPQPGSVTHWHYWCWADSRNGFQFSSSTHTWALGKPPGDWHLDAVGRALVWGLDTLGPGSTVDLLGDLLSHFASATLSSGISEMGTLFPTLPASPIKWGRGIARALKRLMGRQGVIMALASNPLNSLKTRERGQETERSRTACNSCQVTLASRATGGVGEGRENR